MSVFNEYFKHNKKLFFILFGGWLAGAVCALLCVAKICGNELLAVEQYVLDTFERKAHFWEILKNGITTNAFYTLFMLISSLHICFAPLIVAAVAFEGFGSALCAGFFLKIYSFKGVLPAFLSVVLPLGFSLVPTIAMSLCAVGYSLEKRNRLNPERAKNHKAQLSHLFKILVLFIYLSIVSFGEALICVLLCHIL